MMLERDPEEVGPEHPDDLELRMDTQASMHYYEPHPDTGKCQAYLIRHGVRGALCNSTQEYSILHIDESPGAQFNEGGSHWHGGGDCMCFENYG